MIEVRARSLDSAADPVLTLLDSTATTLATVDDAGGGGGRGRRRGGGGSRDPSLLWTAPADGTYTLVLRDVAGGSRGGPDFYYRLTVAPPQPALSLTIPSAHLVLKPGEKLELAVTISR